MASPYLAQGDLVAVLPDWSIRPVPIYAVTATKVHTVKTRIFLDFVQKSLKVFGAAE
jgi:DNA-binding transcriptional LysR family regulator